MKVLAIETSCDETAASIVEERSGELGVLAHTVSSQADLHAKYGGVVPNVAAREHVKNMVPVLKKTLAEAKCSPADIDAIAVTQGPGLIPALLVGVSAAKTLALAWDKPLLGINHLEGHIYANFIGQNFKYQISNIKNDTEESLSRTSSSTFQTPDLQFQAPSSEFQASSFKFQISIFPLLALIVSGGHTMLVLMRDHFRYEILGETEDDAAGEAFDKVGKMLGLPYPGGPEVARRADQFRNQNKEFRITNFDSSQNDSNSNLENSDIQSKLEIQNSKLFPRPMIDSVDYRFSFSGLKTAVLYFLKKHTDDTGSADFKNAVCHEFQEAVVDVLVGKTEQAIGEYAPRTVTIAGGVSANVRLRERMEKLISDKFPEARFLMPEFKYSLDNASMIGAAAALRLARMQQEEIERLKENTLTLEPNANLPLA